MPREPAQARKLALILACSLLVHALLLVIPGTRQAPPERSETGRIDLVAPPSSRASRSREKESTLSRPDATATTEVSHPSDSEASPPPSIAVQPEPDEPPAPDPSEIRRQALDLAGQAGVDNDNDMGSPALTFRSVPRLPGATGWMDAHVGTVPASREHWQAADGGLHSRIVTSSGRVVCASIRPPTMQEFFNPSMSAAVTMIRDCGRERPRARQADDPWQRSTID